MYSHVNIKIRQSIEFVAAFQAREGFLVSMENLVVFQLISADKVFVTNYTNIFYSRAVVLVRYQLLVSLKAFMAVLAFEQFFTVLPFTVSLKSSFSFEVGLAQIAPEDVLLI